MSFPRASARRRARSKPPLKPWPTRAPAPPGSECQTGLYRADQLDANGIGGDDGPDRPRADRRHGQRSYPFKVLVGPDNLTANGIDIPDVAGAVFSGTASGDWTLVRARSGAQHHVRLQRRHDSHDPRDREGNQQNNQQRDGLGWISDPHGIPCVSGERRSNAQQYLGSQALITAAGAGVASLIEWQRPHVLCRLGRLHRHRGHHRPRSGRPDSRGRCPGHVGLGQQALRPSLRRRLCRTRRQGCRPPRNRSPSTSIPKAARSITAQEKAMPNLTNLARGLAAQPSPSRCSPAAPPARKSC